MIRHAQTAGCRPSTTAHGQPADGGRGGPDPRDPDQDPDQDPGPDPDEGLGDLLDAISRAGGATLRLTRLRLSSARFAARRLGRGAVLGLLMGLGGATLIVLAVAAVVRGVTSGAAALLGNTAWVGDLFGGALLLAVLAAAWWIATSRSDRRFLRRLQKELGQVRRGARRGEHR